MKAYIFSKEAVQIWDNVPKDYQGPLFYRLGVNQALVKGSSPAAFLKCKSSKIKQQVDQFVVMFSGHYDEIRSEIYDAEGNIVGMWRDLGV